MPIYEYHCSKCGNFEAMQKMSDKPLTQCPTCRRKVTKLISATSFQLKGSGWYVTDYARKDSGKSEAKQEKKGEQGKKGDAKDAGSSAGTTSSSSETTSSGDTSSTGKSSGGKKSSEKAAAA
jgi:putative FmdB family regulatory protein